MIEKIATLAALVGLLAACTDQPQPSPPPSISIPVMDMVSGNGGVETGWTPVGTTASRPAMSLYEFRRPSMIITCEDMSLRVQVRDLEPKQAWPQPELKIAFGTVERSAVPDVRNIGEQVAYEIRLRITDDVLEQISAGSPIEARFNDQSKAFLAMPQAQAQAFSSGCAALLPPPLRRPD